MKRNTVCDGLKKISQPRIAAASTKISSFQLRGRIYGTTNMPMLFGIAFFSQTLFEKGQFRDPQN